MSRGRKILVINLTRLGDILQSTALLRALKENDRNATIHFLAVDRFAEVCRFIPEIDQVIPFSFESALAASKEAISQLSRRLDEVSIFIESLREHQYDIVINLSHSRISALLCHLLQVSDTRGLVLDREGFRQVHHPWANYFFTANLNRTFNRFNIVDINLGLAELKEGADCSMKQRRSQGGSLSFSSPNEAQQKAKEIISNGCNGKKGALIGLQPGASLANKRWPSSSFVELGQALKHRLSARLVIFGSAKETELAAQIASGLGDDVLNLTGQTDIPLLAASLQQLDLLISNDTGTQHLAAAVGTPVLSLCFGSALSHETGPYGKGHLVVEASISCFPCSFHVECPRFRCQEQVAPEAVFRLAQEMMAKPGRPPQIEPDDPLFQGTRVWRTDFDPHGFWIERPLVKRSLTSADLINLVSREIWIEVLSPINAQRNPDKTESVLALVQKDYAGSSPNLAAEVGRTLIALKKLQACANVAIGHCRDLHEEASSSKADLDKIRRLGDQLTEEDQNINLIGASHPEVNSLVLDFVWGKQNLQGHDLARLAAASEQLYVRLLDLSARHESVLESVMAASAHNNFACCLQEEMDHARV